MTKSMGEKVWGEKKSFCVQSKFPSGGVVLELNKDTQRHLSRDSSFVKSPVKLQDMLDAILQ